jgi:hypothetical protein
MYPEGRSALKILTDKSTRNGRLGRPRRRMKDNIRNIKMNLEKWMQVRGIGLIRLKIGIIGDPL